MAYDEQLAERVRSLVAGQAPATEKRMFGGLAFLIGGNMSVAVSGQGGLLLRCEPERTDELLQEPGAAPMEMRGRAMEGWLRLDPAALQGDGQLERWVALSVGYARTLPAKD